ncbi:MAG: ATP-binding protein, partial [Vicinamibacterales bacterium]
VYAGGVSLVVSRIASRALDSRIRAEFLWAAEMWEVSDAGQLTWFDVDVQQDEDNPWLQVWHLDGRLAFQTSIAKRIPLAGSDTLARQATGQVERVDNGGLTYRVLSRGLTVGDRPVIIQVARSEAPMWRELYELVLFLGLGLPFGVCAAALGGYALARGALSPIRRMAARAQTITADRLHDRLPVDNPHDELGQLAGVFNRTLERLEQSFGQMQRFTADVSHELRTPLTAMRTVGEVALRQARTPEAYQTTIGSMLEDADRLTSLVDQLLTLSRAEASEHVRAEMLDLGDLAEDVVSHLAALADVKDQVVHVQRPASASCRADRVLIRQAVINLVDNAIKYGPAGSTIDVTVRHVDGDVAIDVVDRGAGIPAAQVARVFDRFYRGALVSDGRSHGLGLAIVKAVVEANGGTVSCESRVGHGSTFCIRLPRVEPEARVESGSAPASHVAVPIGISPAGSASA